MRLASQFFHGQDRLGGPLPPELCAPSYRSEIVGFSAMTAAEHGQFGKGWYAGFPDVKHVIDEARPTDIGIAVRFTANGTHTGDFMGIPPTNRKISVPAYVFLTVEDGK